MYNLNELKIFALVARERSFTKAAAQLGISQSALSHAMRQMEENYQIKLLNRTTRSVSTTEAGEKLYQRIAPLLEQLEQEIQSLGDLKGGIKGSLRIDGSEFAFYYVLWDKLQQFMAQYPEVSLELSCDNKFNDIVAERFDAGIRLGEDVAKDMIALRIAPDLEMCTVASPNYLAQHGQPQTPNDLTRHNCLAMRLKTHGGLLKWEFKNPQQEQIITFSPNGNFISNNANLLHKAVQQGLGIAWSTREAVRTQLATGQLVEILSDWAIKYEGLHLYYPHRHYHSPAFRAFVDALRIE